MKGIFNEATLIVVAGVVWWGVHSLQEVRKENQAENEAREKTLQVERAFNLEVIQNCKNAIRKMADAQTVTFGPDYLDGGCIDCRGVERTDQGFTFRIYASDATTMGRLVAFRCYMDGNKNVVRVVPS